MERKSKWLSLLMASCLLIGILPVTSFAEEPGELYVQTDSTEVESRQGHVGEVLSTQEHRAIEARTRSLQADGYLDTVAEAAAMLREGMKNRQEQIEIRYMADADSSYEQIASSIQSAALAHTGVPTEGDYLLWQIGQMYSSANYYIQGDTAYYEMIFCVEYYTSWGEEQWVTERVEDLLGQLISDEMTDYVKTQTVYDWICKNVCYDHDNLEVDSYKTKYTAYAALINGTAVCQGYATLMYRLALEMGIDCRVIAGVSNEERHSWNIVQLDGIYYNLDATWDAEYVQAGKQPTYFLCNDVTFFDHTRDSEYLTDAFLAEYPMAKVNYGEEDHWINHAAAAYAGGTGTKEDPYLISMPEELARLAIKPETAYYKLIEDIDLSRYPWKPIPKFTGVLDGNGYKIYNMSILKTSYESCGFIAFAETAEFKHLLMENWSIENVDTKDHGLFDVNIGLLVGTGQGCTISDCKISGEICYKIESGSPNVGLAIGTATGNTTIRNVHCSGSIDVRTESGGLQAGGIIGLLGEDCVIERSSFSGTIDIKVAGGGGWAVNVGGIVGGAYWTRLTMRNCYSIVDANAESVDGLVVGGAIGWINNDDNCSVELRSIYSAATMVCKDINTDDTYCGLFNGGTRVGNKFTEDKLTMGSQSTCREIVSDCGFFAHGKLFVYEDCDEVGQIELLTEEYFLTEHTVSEIFSNVLQFDETLWEIEDGYYPALQGRQPKEIPQTFEHNYQEQGCAACGEVDKTFSASGTWGQLDWRVENGTLTISGEGGMQDGVYNDVIFRQEFPWSYFGVEKIVIEPGVTTIAPHAFWNMEAIREISLPNTLEYLGSYALMGCKNLQEIYIPGKTDFVINDVLSECVNLKAIEVAPENMYYSSADGVVYSKDKSTLVKVPAGYKGHLAVLDGVTTVAQSAVAECRRISSVDLPDTLTEIKNDAFRGTRMKSIQLPPSLIRIGDFAFTWNQRLEEIIIPASVQSIGNGAFNGCSRLTDIYYRNDEAHWAAIEIGANNDVLTTATIHCGDATDYTPGDINGDGKVNNKDASRLFQYLSGWDVEVVDELLDINGDGKVNNKDASRLFQYLSGWSVEIH